MTRNTDLQMFGSLGNVNTSDTNPVTGNFCAITLLADSEFSALTEKNATGSITGILMPAGLTLVGKFTGYTLASGAIRAYIGSNSPI